MAMLEIALFTDPGCPWAFSAEPLATREVAVVMGVEHDQAAAALAEVAKRRGVGADAYWTL
ncbi:MAG: hypothetical protein NTZ58_06940 [Solirubrobacterales bacterium]|nr:hypothetical protein [Solirubrobacterales bacterium]